MASLRAVKNNGKSLNRQRQNVVAYELSPVIVNDKFGL